MIILPFWKQYNVWLLSIMFIIVKTIFPCGKSCESTVSTLSSHVVHCLSFIKTLVPSLSLSSLCLVDIYKLLLWRIVTSRWSCHTLIVTCWINKLSDENVVSSSSCYVSLVHDEEQEITTCVLMNLFHFHEKDLYSEFKSSQIRSHVAWGETVSLIYSLLRLESNSVLLH